MRPTAQWNGDNAQEIEHLLRHHVARADKDGDCCHIIGLQGLDIRLNPGDRLVVEGDRLGVLRTAITAPDPTITWEGANVPEIARFLSTFKVRLDVIGNTLFIYGEGENAPAVLNRGDRLIQRQGMIVVSKAGKEHRA
jgi:hypothetical protein